MDFEELLVEIEILLKKSGLNTIISEGEKEILLSLLPSDPYGEVDVVQGTFWINCYRVSGDRCSKAPTDFLNWKLKNLGLSTTCPQSLDFGEINNGTLWITSGEYDPYVKRCWVDRDKHEEL